MWDPDQYLRYADERTRPFHELLARVPTERPRRVVDLGCGPGNATAELAARWPDAHITGLDNDPAMIAATVEYARPGRLDFRLADIGAWRPEESYDVVVTNAALQWVPGHLDRLPRWADALTTGGALALQVPGNHADATHVLLRELAESARWKERLDGVVLNRGVPDVDVYLDALARPGFTVDAWETSYRHVLSGVDPVLNWVKGTALRPVLAALDAAGQAEFTAEYGALLRDAYPARSYGTVLRFRRLFAVAVRTP
ncbi:trans-aconitate 2-methyltransferase [Yinghuangia seranimata]|uniref:trans-aconitate 2-methyltransferase n=1 Tax=Yinghuangia seranimata TaxID=408067 RepID=UPI00248C135E|nr:trans-aconitate 2-methyltransferase [Yinghuangia seranimata]MDI2126755.1 trans-aconitate 2-methyltransferase [Yinghuangia seranimata]